MVDAKYSGHGRKAKIVRMPMVGKCGGKQWEISKVHFEGQDRSGSLVLIRLVSVGILLINWF